MIRKRIKSKECLRKRDICSILKKIKNLIKLKKQNIKKRIVTVQVLEINPYIYFEHFFHIIFKTMQEKSYLFF